MRSLLFGDAGTSHDATEDKSGLDAPLLPLAGVLAIWLALSPLSAGDARPLPYLPLVNPVDAVAVGALLVLRSWFATARNVVPNPAALFGALAFLALNGAALRLAHHYGGVPYGPEAMLASVLVQAMLSLLWTGCALLVMWRATRTVCRPLWMTGAALLAAVVLKLFLIDLAGAGTLDRVVSFIGVGLGLLAIGYLAPVPPSAAERERQASSPDY